LYIALYFVLERFWETLKGKGKQCIARSCVRITKENHDKKGRKIEIEREREREKTRG